MQKISRTANRGRALFFTERTPAHDMEIKKTSNEKGLVTTTKICHVKVFIKVVIGGIRSKNVEIL